MKASAETSLTTRLSGSFYYLCGTSFLGALNDNIFKLLIIYFLVKESGAASTSEVMAQALFVFALPFLLFSAWSGNLADRISKRSIIVTAKLMELALMGLGCVALWNELLPLAYLVFFLMSTQSTLFGPSKYGIIPELLHNEALSKGNALMEMLVYLAIIIGTVLAPFFSDVTGGRLGIAALFCIGVSVLGVASSWPIERTKAAGATTKPSLVFVKDIFGTLAEVRTHKTLFLSVLASACFMLLGAFLQANIIPYGVSTLGWSEEHSTYLFLNGAVGIGLGAILAGKMSGRGVEIGLIPLGALGLALSQLFLGILPKTAVVICVLIFLAGFSAGLFVVPIRTLIQMHSPRERLGKILAASSFLGWLGVLTAAGLLHLLNNIYGMAPAQSFIVMGLLTLVLTIVMLRMLPDFFTRLLFMLLMRFCYRIKAYGVENVPLQGPALLVSNHVSWVDGLLIMATQTRIIRFILAREFFQLWWLKPFLQLGNFIPISATDPPKKIIEAFRRARAAMDKGELAAMFPEGFVTRTGMMYNFKGGIERVMKGSAAPMIPVYIGGAWGSVFSYAKGKLFASLPEKFPYPVSVLFGKPLPASSSAFEVRQAVTELSCDYYQSLKNKRRSLIYFWVKSARKNWGKRAVADVTGKRLSHGKLLAAALALAGRLKGRLADQEMVGVLTPASVGGAIANLSVTMLGKVAVNLNFTASPEALQSAINQCQIKTIVTSRAFLEAVKVEVSGPQMIYLEDILGEITKREKLLAFAKARCVPARLLAQTRRFDPDRRATVIFSSGSTGEPKGVMLSHHNLISNVDALQMVFRFKPDDNICGVLPLFHSFGFTATLWLPLLAGISVVYVPNPLDAANVGQSAAEHRSTLLLSTPTFLTAYSRRVEPKDFSSLRLVVAGAEKLKKRVADTFEKRFGIRPMEGYGTTELAPTVSLNLPDVEVMGHRQVGAKEGSVGHPLPGIAAKVVDPQGHEPLELGESGLLLLKGPNVMLGYLNKPEKTAEVLKDGWYHTGDIAKLDADGFITITDRIARFSKLGGEMVAHGAIEDVLLTGLDASEQFAAVTSIPDEKKGEQLVVLYLEEAGDPDRLHELVSNSTLPNLSKPRRDHYFKIEAIPLLGSGKLDILKLRALAVAAKDARQEAGETPSPTSG